MMPPPTEYSRVRVYSPRSTSDALAVVPPMSKLMTFSIPVWRAIARDPTTPAAGPDSTMLTGLTAASAAGVRPPFDCMMSSGAATPRVSSPSRRVFRYRSTIGST